jgi:hypothetical protein
VFDVLTDAIYTELGYYRRLTALGSRSEYELRSETQEAFSCLLKQSQPHVTGIQEGDEKVGGGIR